MIGAIVKSYAGSAIFAVAIATASAADFNAYKNLPYANEAPPSCPPPGLTSMKGFNLTAYVQGRWYIQEQMPVSYLKADSLYCVSARYEVTEVGGVSDAGVLQPVLNLFKSYPGEVKVDVFNYANKNEVNGKNQIGNLGGVVPKPNENPAQLLVGPKFLPRLLWGPYWIVAAGPGPKKYSWALVSGGLPKQTGEGGYCETGDGTNNSGLWIFTRAKVANATMVHQIQNIAKGLGYDTSVLLPVVQEGCNYEGIQQA